MTTPLDPVWYDLVDLAVAAFQKHDDEASLGTTLEAAGVSPETTDELIAFVPIAFGRRLLATFEGIQVSPDFVIGDDELGLSRPLVDEPVFVAATGAATRSGRETLMRLTMWSSEVRAVNAALHAGSHPEDLVLSPPIVSLPGRSFDRAPPSAPREPTDFYGLGDLLALTVGAHGVPARAERASAITDRGERWEARVFPRELSATRALTQVDFAIRSPRWPDRELVECFAGSGANIRAAVRNAHEKMLRGTLHVALSVLGDESCCDDQVTWESWDRWRACVGPMLHPWGPAPAIDYGPMLDRVRDLVLAADLSREVHWIRIFCAQDGEERMVSEGLLDNHPWPALEQMLAAWSLPASERAYALRLFLAIVPT